MKVLKKKWKRTGMVLLAVFMMAFCLPEAVGASEVTGETVIEQGDGSDIKEPEPEPGPEPEKKAVERIALSHKSLTLQKGKRAKLAAEVFPEDAHEKSIIWKSSNTQVATVADSGEIKAKSKGTAVITAKAADGSGVSASCKVTVRNKFVTSIQLKEKKASVVVGQTVKIVATAAPKNADMRSVTYQSSDEKIATVSSKGTIKGVKPGKAKITVTAKDGSGKKAVFSITVRKYQRDKKYYPVTEEIKLPSGGYSISTKNIGLKVIRVNKKLLHSSSDRYTYRTKEAVKRFQRKKGLKVTGIVNKKTWLKMGLSEKDWYNLGTYRTPLKVDEKSSRKDYTNAMLKTAAEYAKAGTAYRVGCSGKPGTYVDCSGLIYQCLYSAGINPDTNIVDHALAKYEYTSNYLSRDSKLGKTVSYSRKKPGDIVFYCKSRGSVVVHVGIYAGNGKIYDAWPGIGVTKRSIHIAKYRVSKIVRVF